MSWYADRVSDWYSGILNGAQFLAPDAKYIDDFIDSERSKAGLRGAEITSFIGGLPLVGDIVKGIDGINRLEDLYDNTGKVPEYPAVQNTGTSSLGKGTGGITRKIENGTHDLFHFYSGDKDDTIESLHEKGIMQYGDEI